MPKLFRIALAAAAICTAPMATIAIAADHRDGSLSASGPATVTNDGKKSAAEITPEHAAIQAWRKKRVLIRRPPIVRPPVIDQ